MVRPEELVERQFPGSVPRPRAMRIAKQLMKGKDISLADRMEEEVKHFGAQVRSEEARAAFMAFMARKKG